VSRADGAPSECLVPVLDLRAVDVSAVLRRDFAATLAGLAAERDAPADCARIIVIDDVGGLADHHDVFEHVFGSALDISVLCLAIGASRGGRGTVLRRPAQLSPPHAATVWVGDVDGVSWRMDSHRAGPRAPGAKWGDGAPRTPEALVSALRLPPVFDAVIERVGVLPGAVACPGLRLVAGDVGGEESARALAAGVRALAVRQERQPDGRGLYAAAEAILADSEANQAHDGYPAIADEGLAESHRRARDAVRRAQTALAKFCAPSSLFTGATPTGQSLDAASQALADLVAAAEQTVRRVDSPGPGRPPRDEARAAAVFDTVESAVLEDFGARDPLPAIAERLRDNAERVLSHSADDYRRRLAQLRPETWARRLKGDAKPMAGPPSADTAASTAAATALAALPAGAGPAGAALVAAAAIAGAVWVRARMAARFPGRGIGWTTTWGHIAVAAGGAVLGAVLAVLLWGTASSTTGLLLAAAAGLAAAGVLMPLWWNRAARAWSRTLGLASLLGAADRVSDLAARAARDGAKAGALRSVVYDHERILAGVVDDTARALRELTDEPGSGPPHASRAQPAADARPAFGDPADVGELVVGDLSDIAAEVFSRFAAAARGPGSRMVAWDAVREETERLLTEYRRHLLTAGVYHDPPVCRDPETRRARVDAVWSRVTRLPELVWSGADDERFVQLCAATELTQLDADSAGAQLIRFAPYAARRALAASAGAAGVGTQVVWTGTSRMFGMVRLVALRPGVVEEVWSMTAPPVRASRIDAQWGADESLESALDPRDPPPGSGERGF
jgi:hypothetical protein